MKNLLPALLFLSVILLGAQTPAVSPSHPNSVRPGPRYDVSQFGAYATGSATTGTVDVSTNATLLTLAASVHLTAGMYIQIPGAGAGGANLLARVTAVANGGTAITFAPAASTSVSRVAIDDTLGIQAAFNACWNNTSAPFGGIVEFPGPHSYVVSSTINAYDGCQIEGVTASASNAGRPVSLYWNGPAVGSQVSISSFTTAANSPTCYNSSYCYSSAFPLIPGGTQNRTTANVVTVNTSSAHGFSVNQWVDIAGLSSNAGITLNRGIMQIASVPSSKQFIALVPFNVTGGVNSVTYGAYADTGTATSVNVFVALDASARYNQSISNLYLLESSKLPTADDFGVGIYFGGRIDAGTHIEDVWVDSPSKYSYYFTAGGINVDFDRGWRSDGAGIAGIYWRAGADNFRIANGTITNDQTAGSPYDGVAVMLDASQCLNGFVRMNESNIKTEIAGLASGMGIYTMLDCPAFANGEQFFLDMEGVWNSINSAGTVGNNYSSFAMIPANDVALNLAILNSQMQAGSGSNTTQRFIGLPALARNDLTGATGFITSLFYAPPFKSAGIYVPYQQSLMQSIGDSNFNQIYQYGIPASTFLYSDTAYAALPNATTLNAGQILAPPAYWSEANGKRYALDVVYRTGTTGTPNSGATTCIGSLRTRVLTCSSATDLSPGQRIKIGVDDNKTIKFIDATHPDAVRVNLTSSLAASYSREPLAFSAPLLASEIQMPTKSPGAPATQSWLQGDTEQNSRAAANGVAAWVNVAPGTPGSWAGIPLGDSNGKIAESQLYSARTAHAFCSDTAASSSTILLFGAGGSQNSCTQSPGPQALQQILMNTSGTLSNLAVRCGHSGSEPSSGRFTVWDLPSGSPMSNASSGINTGLSVIIGNSPANANRTILDTTHSFSYAAGDMIRIQFTTGANEALSDCTAAFNY